jgi:hypothetical protein
MTERPYWLVPMSLCFRLVIYTIKSNYSLQEDVKLWVSPRVLCHLEQRLEKVYEELRTLSSLRREANESLTLHYVFKVLDLPVLMINIIEAGYLDQPSDVGREDLILKDPFGKLIPF